MNLFDWLKLFFWRLNSCEVCPFCGGHLTEHGFRRLFTCDFENCKFNNLECGVREEYD